MRRANAALAPRQRLVLALRELEDRSYAEIGELVGLKENAVAQLISRARLRLREELRLVEVDRSKLPAECQELLPALSAYLDGQLGGAVAERMLAHVESCENCQKALVEMREASKLYRALLPIPFPELFGRIDDALAAGGAWSPASSILKSKAAWLAAAAVAGSLAVVALLGALALRQDAEPAAAPVTTPTPADTAAPELTLPQQTVVREATSPAGAAVAFVTSAEDGVDGAVAVTCSPASGEVFALGTTKVSCAAQDAAGNEAEGSFDVEVADSKAPVVTVPASLEVEAKGPDGARVAYAKRAKDAADPTVGVRCTPAADEVFPLGETTVECTARDGAGNVARKRFTVSVVDSTPPALTLPETVAVEAGAPVSYSASARDAVDGTSAIDCSVPSGRVLPLGQTIVECTSEDAAGNVATLLHSCMSFPWSNGLFVEGVSICAAGAHFLRVMPKPGFRASAYVAPNIVFKGGRPVLASGSPSVGLLANVVQNTTNVLDFGLTLEQSVRRPRFGGVSFTVPGASMIEVDVDEKVRAEAARRGASFEVVNPWNWHHGSFEGIFVDAATGVATACGDPRRRTRSSPAAPGSGSCPTRCRRERIPATRRCLSRGSSRRRTHPAAAGTAHRARQASGPGTRDCHRRAKRRHSTRRPVWWGPDCPGG